MNCELCGDEKSGTLVLLPIRQSGGKLETLACLACAKKSSAYCRKHNRPHLGFDDGTTACVPCIEETVAENAGKATEFMCDLKRVLPLDEWERLTDWVEDSCSITGNSDEICVLRALATKALRSKRSIQEVAQQVSQNKTVDYILGDF